MTVKTGSAWAGTFVTLDATGALATPSTGPAGTLYVDGVANGATVTITGSNPYKFAVTLPSLTAGQRVDMYITATISSIATAGVVASAQADTVLVSDVKTETAAILEDTGTTLDGLIKDVPTVAEFEARTKPAADYALEATLTAIKGAGWTNETLAAIDTLIDAIKAKSDLIPAQPAAVGSAMTLTSAYDAAKSAASQSSVNAIPTAPLLAANYTAPDNAGITAIKAKTDNLPASPAAVGSLMGLADGAITDAKIATDALSAAKIKADAVTKIQNGLALEATLTAIKGAGWTNETLAKIVVDISNISAGSGATAQEVWEYATRVLTAGTNIDLSSLATTTHLQEVEDKVDTIDTNVDAVLADTNELQTDLVNGGRLDLLVDSIITHLTDIKGGDWDAEDSLINIFGKVDAVELVLTAIKGAGWTNETLAAIKAAIDAIDVSALATTTHLQEVEDKVDNVPTLGGVASIIGTLVPQCVDLSTTGSNVTAIKAKTDNLPADPADDSDIDAQLAAVKTVVDAIKTETDGHPTAAEVWSYGTRTLTNSTTGAVTPAEGDTLEVTKDATIIINFTGLGDISAYDDDTTDEEDKVWFTAKANLDDPDSSAVIQIHTLYPAGTTPPDTLDYINGVAATATEGTFQFTDLVAGNATLTLAAAAAADLPVYAVSPLYWDIKILDYSAGTVSVLASGEMYIYGTPTKSIA